MTHIDSLESRLLNTVPAPLVIPRTGDSSTTVFVELYNSGVVVTRISHGRAVWRSNGGTPIPPYLISYIRYIGGARESVVDARNSPVPFLVTFGRGNDRFFGGFGNDTVSGGDGHDFLYGGSGNDVLVGGNGNDILVGGEGADSLTGGAGRDEICAYELTNDFDGQIDTLIGSESADRIRRDRLTDILRRR